LFGLARLATSGGVTLQSNEILGCVRYNLERGAKIEDVLEAWVMLGWMLAFTALCFAIEIISKTLHFGFYHKTQQNWTLFQVRMRKLWKSEKLRFANFTKLYYRVKQTVYV